MGIVNFLNKEKGFKYEMKFSNVFLFALARAQDGEEGDAERWGGSVSGDPHFVIEGPNMDRLCFDYTPTVEHDIALLSDPTSALSVTGTPSKRIDGKIVLTNIHFKSPGGAMLEFDHDGFKMPSDEDVISVKYGHIKYHDVTLYDNWKETTPRPESKSPTDHPSSSRRE